MAEDPSLTGEGELLSKPERNSLTKLYSRYPCIPGFSTPPSVAVSSTRGARWEYGTIFVPYFVW